MKERIEVSSLSGESKNLGNQTFQTCDVYSFLSFKLLVNILLNVHLQASHLLSYPY